MNKKLAIKGHPTRGKEVIELLEMLGGVNIDNFHGIDIDDVYVIDKYNNICFMDIDAASAAGNHVIFTLEEFLEKYPHKVGDKVVDCYRDLITIKSMKWSNDFETMVYDFEESEDVLCAEDIESVNDTDDNTKPSKMKNVLAELFEHIKTTPKEELEREFEELEEWSNVGLTVEEFRTFCECVNKKLKYPKTYAECKEILGEKSYYGFSVFTTLQNLIMCRDAYWKIAGEQMGLDKPWDPTYGCGGWGYWIGYSINENKIYLQDSRILVNHTLVFPTEEMRDVFYENFKDLIEQCKSLL